MDNDRQKALDTVIKNMEKSFGKGTVQRAQDFKDGSNLKFTYFIKNKATLKEEL